MHITVHCINSVNGLYALVVQVKSKFYNAIYQNDEAYLVPRCFLQLRFSLIYVKAIIFAFYLKHSQYISHNVVIVEFIDGECCNEQLRE